MTTVRMPLKQPRIAKAFFRSRHRPPLMIPARLDAAPLGNSFSMNAGQMSRVDSVKLAVMKPQSPLNRQRWQRSSLRRLLPLPRRRRRSRQAGATAVIQPGGSVKDPEVIAAANRLNLAMVLTGIRRFLH